MPISFLKCHHDWLPPVPMALENQRPLSWRVHDAMVFTHSLTEVLPDFAKKAVEEGDNRPLVGAVTVEPICFHPWSRNVSTFCYEIQPGDGGLTDPHEQQARRAVIYASLRRDITAFAESYDNRSLLEGVTFDIEVGRMSRTGCTLRYEAGQMTGLGVPWGMPS